MSFPFASRTVPQRTTLHNYSRIDPCDASVFTLRSVEEAQQLLRTAQEQNRKVVFRGGGDSLHDQSQGRDWVAQLRFPPTVRYLQPRSIRASASATWRDVWSHIQPMHFVPGVVPNTERATLGGTLSANCLCQFSPILGKEANGIESFLLLTAQGERLEVCRPGPDSSDEDSALFYTVIGGLGSLGLVTEIQHRLLTLPFDGQARMQSIVTHIPDTETLLKRLIDAHHENHPKARPKSLNPWYNHSTLPKPSPLGVLHNKGYGCLIEKEFVPFATPRSPFLLHSPKTVQNILGNLIVMLPHVSELFWKKLHSDWKHRTKPFVDDLSEALFSMEGNRTARALLRKVGVSTICPQQTFVLPISSKQGPYNPSLRFMESVFRALRDYRFSPSLIDMLTLPADRIALSSSRDMDGVAITLSFQQFGERRLAHLTDMLFHLSRECARQGGRVHLVKNVFVEPDVLQDMYRQGLAQWRESKRRLDPDNLFVSNLFARLFPYTTASL